MSGLRAIAIWIALIGAMVVPVVLAATSPLLAWRDSIYIIAGFAGILGMVLLLVQPLLAAGLLPKLPFGRARVWHRRIGVMLVLAVVVHVGALWITSPPDVVDALLFASPAPFSAWGVVAMWAIFGAALIAGLRKRMKLRPGGWRLAHTGLVSVVVIGTVVHALLIQGTMESMSKWVLAVATLAVFVLVIGRLKVWKGIRR